MKKRTFIFILCFLFIICLATVFCACSQELSAPEKEPPVKDEPSEELQGTDILIEGFTEIKDESLGEVYYISLPNAQIRYSLSGIVKVNKNSQWSLSTDVYGNEVIASKTVILLEGNNVYYVMVTDEGGNIEQYILLIRRRPMYTVTFFSHITTVFCEQKVEEGACATVPEGEPERTGYTFNGWVMDFSTPIDKDRIVIAFWVANEYTITYDVSGGQLSSLSQKVTYQEKYTLAEPTREGYDFEAWYYGEEKIVTGDSWEIANDVILYAKWIPKTYRIEYDLAGGVNAPENKKDYTIEQTVVLKAPEKTGYAFTGWTGTDVVFPEQEVTIERGSVGDRQFVAHWQPKTYKIFFDPNGGTCATEKVEVIYDSFYTLPEPQKTGYHFEGWYYNETEQTGETVWQIPNDVTFVAKWGPNTDTPYAVQHFLQNITDDEYTLKETEYFNGVSDSNVTPAVKKIEGFTSPSSQNIVVAADGSTIVKYYYLRNKYTTSFVLNGGEQIEPIELKYQAEFVAPQGERKGFTFGGWFTEETLSAPLMETIVPSANRILYAWWEEEAKPIEFEYSVGEEVCIEAYIGKSDAVRIPTFIRGSAVTEIDNYAFAENLFVKEVVFPETLLRIGGHAFSGCSQIIKANSENAGELLIPDGIEEIGSCAFEGLDQITEVIIPDSVTEIGIGAFQGCNALKKITLPFVGGSLTAQNYDAVFGYVFGYETKGTFSNGSSSDGDDHYNGYTPSTEFINAYVVQQPENTVWQYSCANFRGGGSYASYYLNSYFYYIPTTLKEVTVTEQTEIPVAAFNGCSFLEKVTLPDGVTGIGGYAFQNCSGLRQLNSEEEGTYNLPKNLTQISESVFKNNNFLKEVCVGTKIEIIGEAAFSGCGALVRFNSGTDGGLLIPSGVTKIEKEAFKGAEQIIEIVVPDSVTEIGIGAFQGCNALEKITLPFVGKKMDSTDHDAVFGYIFGEGTTKTGEGYKDVPETVFVNEKIDDIAGAVWQYSCYDGAEFRLNSWQYNLTSYFYYIPATLKKVTVTVQTEIPVAAFNGCSFLEKVTLPDGVTGIGGYAFQNCSGLTGFVLDSSVTFLGTAVFNGCSSLTDIYCAAAEKPEGWHDKWQEGCQAQVHWRYVAE